MTLSRRARCSAFIAMAAASVLLSACGGSSNDMNPEQRTTRYGAVEGVNDNARSGTYFWKGIPLASNAAWRAGRSSSRSSPPVAGVKPG